MASSQTPAGLPMGTLVNGRFRVKKLLGYGGYGNVYLVEDEMVFLGNQFALKESLSSTTSERRQFTREAKWLMSLEHPNLPRVAEQFEWNSRPYFVMAYVAGENLEDRVDRLGALPEDQVLAWLRPICDAVIYLHSQKRPIIHRDIKPGNIIVTKDGRPWLVDFGIAKVLQTGGSRKTTRAARAVSGGYSPLEQYTRGGTDVRSDVYALGSTLYHLLTGVCPPEAPDIASGVARLPDVRQVNSRVSRMTDQAVMRAMRQKPEERFQSVRELLDALPGGVGFSVSAVSAPPASRPSSSKRGVKGNKASPVPVALPDPAALQPTLVAAPPLAPAPPYPYTPPSLPQQPMQPAATIIGPPSYSPPYEPPTPWAAAPAGGASALFAPPVAAGAQALVPPPQPMVSPPPDKQIRPRRRRVVLANIIGMLCALAVLATMVITALALIDARTAPVLVQGYADVLNKRDFGFDALLVLTPFAALLLLILPICHWLGLFGRGLMYTFLLILPLLGLAPFIAWIATDQLPTVGHFFTDGFFAPFLLFLAAWATALAQLIRRR